MKKKQESDKKTKESPPAAKKRNKKRRAMPSFCFPQNGLFSMKNKIKNNNDDDSTYNRLYDASDRTG